MTRIPRRSWLHCLGAAVLGVMFVFLPSIAAEPIPEQAGSDVETVTAESSILVMIRMAPPHARPDVDYGDGYSGRSGRAARRRAAEAIARTHNLQLLSQWPMPAIGVECFVMKAQQGVSAAALIDAISRDPRAEWAQPLQGFSGQAYNDPLYDQQPTAAAWQLELLHVATTGRGVRIAQIDSGVEIDHPDLLGKVKTTHNAVTQSGYRAEQHGTAVAGILVARANNSIGTVGVSPDAQLIVVRACWERVPGVAMCDSLSLAKALQFALDRNARVINLSVSGPPDRLLRELLRAALARGTIVVASIDTTVADGGFPASNHGVIGVVDRVDSVRAADAGTGPLVAPGRDVPTTTTGARWALVSGSSFAAAEASGLVALLLELLPQAQGERVESLLRGREEGQLDAALSTAVPIDACLSVSRAAGRCVCRCATGPSLFTSERR